MAVVRRRITLEAAAMANFYRIAAVEVVDFVRELELILTANTESC